MSACERSQEWRRSLQLHQGWLLLDTVACNTAISACGKARAWICALVIHSEMKRGMPAASPDVITHNSIVSIYASVGEWKQSTQSLANVWACSLVPNIVTHSAVLSCCERSGVWESALVVLACSAGERLESDTVSYNAMISACEKGQAWEPSLGILIKMHSRLLAQSGVTSGAAVSACEKGDAWAAAVKLLSITWRAEGRRRGNRGRRHCRAARVCRHPALAPRLRALGRSCARSAGAERCSASVRGYRAGAAWRRGRCGGAAAERAPRRQRRCARRSVAQNVRRV